MSKIKLFIADFLSSSTNLFHDFNRDIMDSLVMDGVVILPNYYNDIDLHLIRNELFSLLQNSSQVQEFDNGADVRLFNISQFTNILDFFVLDNELLTYAKSISSSRIHNSVGMANSLSPMPNNLGSGGGWHRDSPYSNQFKAFLFLTDVDEQSGPLRYLKGSHTRHSILSACYHLGVDPSKFRFTDSEVDELCNFFSYEYVDVCVPAGTLVLANVRGLHRGMPIISGKRLALTNYYFGKSVPGWAV